MGFPPIPERAPKSAQNRTFFTLFVQKVRFCTLLGALSGVGGNPTFCADELFGDFDSVARTEIPNAMPKIARISRVFVVVHGMPKSARSSRMLVH